jgi:hypothetical protein
LTDRAVRNLANLKKSASTARVLNLLRVWQEHRGSAGWRDAPMFRHPALNRALILKHRLRRDEVDRFRNHRHVATKIILPIDGDDLRVGGRYLFVDQIGYSKTMQETFGIGPHHPDRHVLALMDELPGLDPFLLREQLRRNGMAPAPCYFNLTEADLTRMAEFVSEEVRPLVDLSLGPDSHLAAVNPVARLTARIMSFTPGEDMSALGTTLQLEPHDYDEGVFCWKGFLYYKWALQSVMGDVGGVLDGVRGVQPHGRATAEQRVDLERARERVDRRILQTCEAAADMLRVYDDAFDALTRRGDPMRFRGFLKDAPQLFARLGERLGAVQHVVSFWKFRMGAGKPRLTYDELFDLLADFETSLSGREIPDVVSLAA